MATETIQATIEQVRAERVASVAAAMAWAAVARARGRKAVGLARAKAMESSTTWQLTRQAMGMRY